MNPAHDPYSDDYQRGQYTPRELATMFTNGNRSAVVEDLRRYSDPLAAVATAILTREKLDGMTRASFDAHVFAVIGLI